MNARNPQDQDLQEIGAEAARRLREGSLKLRDIAGLTDQELRAVADLADALRRQGKLKEATDIYQLLITFDPVAAPYWRTLADLQRRRGQHAAAVVCYEAAALLEGRIEAAAKSEALCLAQLGQHGLACSLREIAAEISLHLPDRPAPRPPSTKTAEPGEERIHDPHR